ncbi:hypothetical protein M8J77_003206 [Diaphorina citri]|nr:hypothetical protein M8J77_003206 [Diaphorina citri]
MKPVKEELPEEKETKSVEEELPEHEETKPIEEELPEHEETKPVEEEFPEHKESKPVEGEVMKPVKEELPEEKETKQVEEKVIKPVDEELPEHEETKPVEEELPEHEETKLIEEELLEHGETKPVEEEFPEYKESKPVEEEVMKPVKEELPEEKATKPVEKEVIKPVEEVLPEEKETKPVEEELTEHKEIKPDEEELPEHEETKPVEELPEHEETKPVEEELPEHEETRSIEELPEHEETRSIEELPEHEETKPVEEELPEHEETKPVGEELPEHEETKPVEEELPEEKETKPVEEEVIKPVEETKPIEEELIKPVEEELPEEKETKPVEGELIKLIEEELPEHKETKPVGEEVIKPVEEELPEHEETTPVEEELPEREETRPVEEDLRVEKETKPVEEELIKPLEEELPEYEETKPVEETKPIEEEVIKPVEEELREEKETKPVEGEVIKLIEEELPEHKETKPVGEEVIKPIEEELPEHEETTPVEEELPEREETRPVEEDLRVEKETKPVEEELIKPLEEELPEYEETKPIEEELIKPAEEELPEQNETKIELPQEIQDAVELPQEIQNAVEISAEKDDNVELPKDIQNDADAEQEIQGEVNLPKEIQSDFENSFDNGAQLAAEIETQVDLLKRIQSQDVIPEANIDEMELPEERQIEMVMAQANSNEVEISNEISDEPLEHKEKEKIEDKAEEILLEQAEIKELKDKPFDGNKINSEREHRPISPNLQSKKCSKFLIRKTYFEKLLQPQTIDPPFKSESKPIEKLKPELVKNQTQEIGAKLFSSGSERHSENTCNSIVNKSATLPEKCSPFTQKSLEHIEPIVKNNKIIFENNLQEADSTKKRGKRDKPFKRHESLESIEPLVSTIKNTYEAVPDGLTDQKESIMNSLVIGGSIRKPEIIEEEKIYSEEDNHDSLENIKPLVQEIKNIYETNTQILERGTKISENVGNIHQKKALFERYSPLECMKATHDSLDNIEPIVLERIEQLTNPEEEKHDSLKNINTVVKDIKNIYKTNKQSIENAAKVSENIGDINQKKTLFERHIPLECIRANHDSLRYIEPIVQERIQQLTPSEVEKHDSLKTLNLVVKDIKNIYEKSKQSIEDVAKVSENTEDINQKKTLFEQRHSPLICIRANHESLNNIEPIVQKIIEELTPAEEDNNDFLKNIKPLVQKIKNIYETNKQSTEGGTEISENFGNINQKKALFERYSPLEHMRATHESLEYIEPIVTSVKNVFEVKSRNNNMEISARSSKFQESSNVFRSDITDHTSPTRQNVNEQNRLTETYVNSIRLSEAIQTEVKSERHCGIVSQGNVSHMQINSENCTNSICDTREIQGVTNSPNTGSPLIEKEDEESDNLKEEKENINDDSEDQIETGSVLCNEGNNSSKTFQVTSLEINPPYEDKHIETPVDLTELPSESQNQTINEPNSIFEIQNAEESTFLSWASNEEFSDMGIKSNIDFDFEILNPFPSHQQDIGELSDSNPKSYGVEQNRLIYDENPLRPIEFQGNTLGPIEFLIDTSKSETSNQENLSEKLTNDESNESSLDYDSIIQAPSLDEALEKLDLKLKKEAIKDFKNDTQKLKLFNTNKSINSVTDEASKLEFCFNVSNSPISNFNWQSPTNILERPYQRSPSPTTTNASNEEFGIPTPEKSRNPFLQISTDESSEPIDISDFDIAELKQPTDILLMGPAEKEIVWGISDEEAIQILQQTCNDLSRNEIQESIVKSKSPELGRLYCHQIKRSPSPLARFLNSSLGTIDETQEDYNISIDKTDETIHLTHTHSIAYGSDSETSVTKEELDLNKIAKSNPSIHISNYDIDSFIENENKSPHSINNEKIIEVILEETLLRPKSTEQTEKIEDPTETVEDSTKKENEICEDENNYELEFTEHIAENTQTTGKSESFSPDLKVDEKFSDTKHGNRLASDLKNDDFDCPPEFVLKWKNYWDKKFNESKELQKTLSRPHAESQTSLKKRKSPNNLEKSENFVTKQRRIFESENIFLLEDKMYPHEVKMESKPKKCTENRIENTEVAQSDVDISSLKPATNEPLTTKSLQSLPLDTTVKDTDSDDTYFPRKPSIKITDIVKKQRQKFESLFRRSFKSKKTKVSNKENLKKLNLPIPFRAGVGKENQIRFQENIPRAEFTLLEISNKAEFTKPSEKSISPQCQLLDENESKDNLAATFKIMKDANMIPQNQTFSEWRQLYGQTRNDNAKSEPHPREQNEDLSQDISDYAIQDTDDEDDCLIYPTEDPFQKVKEEIVQEWKKDLYKKMAKDVSEETKMMKIPAIAAWGGHNKEFQTSINSITDCKSTGRTGGLTEENEANKNPSSKTYDQDSRGQSSDHLEKLNEAEMREQSSKSPEKHMEMEPQLASNNTEIPSNLEENLDQSLSPAHPESLKYSAEYPYIPKTPLEEYQHRSDLYKELITREQLFKLTQFVKK